MALSDFVSVSISATSPSVTRPGFGTPILLSPHTPSGFTERVRVYTDPSELLDDSFDDADGTYLAAVRLCEQNPRPDRFKVGRLALKPTQSWTITPVVSDDTEYALEIDGVAVSITSGTGADAASIVTALKTPIGSPADLTVGGTDTLTLTAITAGKLHSVKVSDPSRLGLVQDQADPGVGDDLAAIALEDPDFYGIHNQFNSRAIVNEIADWAETAEKLFVFQTQDTAVCTVAAGSADDVLHDLHAEEYFYSVGIYSGQGTDNFVDAAWLGAVLPQTPGSEQWGLWNLRGAVADNLTENQYSNVVATQRSGNVYWANQGGISITAPGKVASGEWIDVVRFRDWLRVNMALDVFQAIQKAVQQGKKVPFTDAGIVSLKGVVEARLDKGVDAGGLTNNPAPVVNAPKASAVSDDDKEARTLTGLTFTAKLAGAIIAVKPIRGTVTV